MKPKIKPKIKSKKITKKLKKEKSKRDLKPIKPLKRKIKNSDKKKVMAKGILKSLAEAWVALSLQLWYSPKNCAKPS